ncbi:MAG: DASS family sodium-coupled anion symporter [Candidatus Diapherotrites archaeon]|nr:DASS family sodium-coupled anion symporter [Candidatus Diapherotrites archaeon]
MEKKYIYILLAFLLAIGVFYIDFPLEPQAKIVLSILVFAAVLWFTEGLPLYITALCVPLLLSVFAGITPTDAFSPFFDPIIALLLGGFVLAVAMQKYELDKKMALAAVGLIGHTPGRFLFGMMCVTAFFSMWMSNTASTAIMLPIMIVILTKNKLNPLKSSYGKSAVLGIAFAATLGGIGTIVGTPPNAIAVKFLRDYGINVSFAGWMWHALPLVILMLPVMWLVLTKVFKPEIKKITIHEKDIFWNMNNPQKIIMGVFGLTVALWLTTNIHGISSSIIALVPIISLYLFKLLDEKDFVKANWPVLILVGGGLSLGGAMHSSGLGMFFANALKDGLISQPYFIILLAVAAFSVLMTAFASNTAAASILVPIIIPLSLTVGLDIRIVAIVAGMAASLDFLVPVGTPPSAIAYSSGYIKVKDMFKAGIIISTIGVILLALLAVYLW